MGLLVEFIHFHPYLLYNIINMSQMLFHVALVCSVIALTAVLSYPLL